VPPLPPFQSSETSAAEPAGVLPQPELLAPAGDRDCLRAAIENGADAIYFGLGSGFNARARAANMALDDLPEIMALLHGRGVKGYVTLNTLVFPDELPRAEETIRRIAAAGVDAVVVQDLGVARLVKAVCPALELHASTQMSLSSAEGIAVAEQLGVARVVLARELSLDQIRRLRRQTRVVLEVFVHGALCVAYSGQCLTSEAIGGRSANRGQCAQACRMTYDLVRDGEVLDLGPRKYLLSPQDLAAYDLVPELLAAGVDSLKIEGRLKSPEYVANAVRHYRQALDAALAGSRAAFSPQQVQELEVSFSRGFSHGWLGGDDHQELVPGTSSDKRGALLGHVQRIHHGRVAVRLVSPVKRGDGIVFQAGSAGGGEQGGRVYEVWQQGRSLVEPIDRGLVELTFGHDAIDFVQLRPDQAVFKTDDPELDRRLRKTFEGPTPQRRMPLSITVYAAAGEPLRIEARGPEGLSAQVQSPAALEEAQRHPLTVDTLTQQLSRLGGTAYELEALEAQISGQPMIPLSVLGKLRHALIEQLDAAARRPRPRELAADKVLPRLLAAARISCDATLAATASAAPAVPQLHVLCRRPEQVEPALAAGVRSLVADFQDIAHYSAAVEAARRHGAQISLATPRIHKPGETGLFRVLWRSQPDGILVRNLAALAHFTAAGVPVVADFSLNAANGLTVGFLCQRGARRVTASYDLTRQQLEALAATTAPEVLEVVVHQHMPMFHMEFCVFCSVLSMGTNKTNCGRPCERHKVELRDRVGAAHPLEADVACRNTVYNALAQSAIEFIPTLVRRGVRHLRLELGRDADAASIGPLVALYNEVLAGHVDPATAWRRLQPLTPTGVTRGTLGQQPNLSLVR